MIDATAAFSLHVLLVEMLLSNLALIKLCLLERDACVYFAPVPLYLIF